MENLDLKFLITMFSHYCKSQNKNESVATFYSMYMKEWPFGLLNFLLTDSNFVLSAAATKIEKFTNIWTKILFMEPVMFV